MKAIRAFVQHGARSNMQQYCAQQSNHGHMMKMNGSTSKSNRSRFQQRTSEQLQQKYQPRSDLSANVTSTTMLHIFCVLAFYLFFTTNTITFVGAANLSDGGNGGGGDINSADFDVPTTTEFGEITCKKL